MEVNTTDLIHAEQAAELYEKRKAAVLAVQKDADRIEWVHRLVDASSTLVDSVNGCTPYIGMRKAAAEVDKLLREGYENWL